LAPRSATNTFPPESKAVIIAFKSVPILGEAMVGWGYKRESVTSYDMTSVSSHVLDIERWRILFHCSHLYRMPGLALLIGPMVCVLPAILVGLLAQEYLFSPYFLVPVTLLALWLTHFASERWLLEWKMQALARKERGLGRTVKLAVIKDQNWAFFCSRLKSEPELDRECRGQETLPADKEKAQGKETELCYLCGKPLRAEELAARVCQACRR
jgi:hypothetical protein